MGKILIIDDDPDIVEAMKIVLENKGHAVEVAYSGEDGLRVTKEVNPDLIILDIMMETADKGFDVARILKKDEKYKSIPILMLTAIEDKKGLSFKKEAGHEDWLPVDGYVEKPLKPEELIAKVGSILNKK